MSWFDDNEDMVIGFRPRYDSLFSKPKSTRSGAVQHIRDNFTWTTKDGREMKLSEMNGVHLSNVRRLILKRMKGYESDEQFRLVASAISKELGSRR